MRAIMALLAGVVFALGLALAGMTQPEKVIAFLDFAGAWDPSLAFVMVAAIGVHGALRPLVLRRSAPLYDTRFHAPDAPPAITPRLVVGSAIFGVGWGLAGYCPGPGVVALGTGSVPALVFVAAMMVGILVERVPGFTERRRVAEAAGSG